MRRTIGYGAFILGWFLVFMGPLLFFYATPRVEKAPYDVYDRTVSTGSGSYFSATELGLVGPVPLRNLSIAKGHPQSSTDDVAVISVFSRTTDLQHGNDIDVTNDVYAFDRSTGYAVHCCGEKPRADGLTLKFPFHTKQGTYRFWDSTAQRAYPATYVRSDTVDGVSAYVFVSQSGPMTLQHINAPGKMMTGQPGPSVPANIDYKATTIIWVEPLTGAILKARQHSQEWLTDSSGQRVRTLSDTTFVNDGPSVREVVDRVKPQLWELRLVSVWLPVAGPLLGVALIVLGLGLLRRAPERVVATETMPLGATAAS
jgi:hypothetical protein